MKVSYVESLASCYGLHRRYESGNVIVLSVRQGGKRRPAIELRNLNFRVLTWSLCGEGNIGPLVHGESELDTAESREPVHAWKSQSREPGEPVSCRAEVISHRYGQRTVQRGRLP
jgi:hypothetical protein